jgi:hypothetical protein
MRQKFGYSTKRSSGIARQWLFPSHHERFKYFYQPLSLTAYVTAEQLCQSSQSSKPFKASITEQNLKLS